MNVVFSVRILISSLTTVSLIVMPRMLYYFGLRADELDAILSPWFTFVVLLFVGGVITYPWLKNIKLIIPAIICIFIIAAILTIYFCELALPF